MSIDTILLKMSGFRATDPPFVEDYISPKGEERKIPFYEGTFLERFFDYMLTSIVRKPRLHVNLTSRKLEIRGAYGSASQKISVDDVNLRMEQWRGNRVIVIKGIGGNEVARIEYLVGAKKLCDLVDGMK